MTPGATTRVIRAFVNRVADGVIVRLPVGPPIVSGTHVAAGTYILTHRESDFRYITAPGYVRACRTVTVLTLNIVKRTHGIIIKTTVCQLGVITGRVTLEAVVSAVIRLQNAGCGIGMMSFLPCCVGG